MLLLTCFHLPESATTNLYVARYLVMLRDPIYSPARQWRFFAEQFNLTQAEARLCRTLADGLTLNDYSTHWRVALNTARSQLKKRARQNRRTWTIRSVASDLFVYEGVKETNLSPIWGMRAFVKSDLMFPLLKELNSP